MENKIASTYVATNIPKFWIRSAFIEGGEFFPL